MSSPHSSPKVTSRMLRGNSMRKQSGSDLGASSTGFRMGRVEPMFTTVLPFLSEWLTAEARITSLGIFIRFICKHFNVC